MARPRSPSLPGKGRGAIDDLPLFPLNTVLFPGGRLPLRLFEQRYLEMAKACLKDGGPFGVCLIREGQEVGGPALPAAVGCLAHIASWDMQQLGVLEIVAVGKQRFRIVERRVQPDGLARARVELLPAESDEALPQAYARWAKLLEDVIAGHGGIFERPHRLDSSAWVSSRLAEILPLPLALKQELLEMPDAAARLTRLNRFLEAPAPE